MIKSTNMKSEIGNRGIVTVFSITNNIKFTLIVSDYNWQLQ